MFPYINHGHARSILPSPNLSAILISDCKMYREDARPTLPSVRDLFRGKHPCFLGSCGSDFPHVDELARSPRPPTNPSPLWIVPGPQNYDRSFSRAERPLDGPGVQVCPFSCPILGTNVLYSVLLPRLSIIHLPLSNAMTGALRLVTPLPIMYHHL